MLLFVDGIMVIFETYIYNWNHSFKNRTKPTGLTGNRALIWSCKKPYNWPKLVKNQEMDLNLILRPY